MVWVVWRKDHAPTTVGCLFEPVTRVSKVDDFRLCVPLNGLDALFIPLYTKVKQGSIQPILTVAKFKFVLNSVRQLKCPRTADQNQTSVSIWSSSFEAELLFQLLLNFLMLKSNTCEKVVRGIRDKFIHSDHRMLLLGVKTDLRRRATSAVFSKHSWQSFPAGFYWK